MGYSCVCRTTCPRGKIGHYASSNLQLSDSVCTDARCRGQASAQGAAVPPQLDRLRRRQPVLSARLSPIRPTSRSRSRSTSTDPQRRSGSAWATATSRVDADRRRVPDQGGQGRGSGFVCSVERKSWSRRPRCPTCTDSQCAEGRPYNLYHGTLEARPATPKTSRPLHTHLRQLDAGSMTPRGSATRPSGRRRLRARLRT